MKAQGGSSVVKMSVDDYLKMQERWEKRELEKMKIKETTKRLEGYVDTIRIQGTTASGTGIYIEPWSTTTNGNYWTLVSDNTSSSSNTIYINSTTPTITTNNTITIPANTTLSASGNFTVTDGRIIWN